LSVAFSAEWADDALWAWIRRRAMQPHNPENSRHGPGTGARQRRSATTFWLIVAIIAFAAAASATFLSYR
jgi:hypothetical protein